MIRRLLLFTPFICVSVHAQTLSLKEALTQGVTNYGTIKAKNKYLDASKENLKQVKYDYVPSFNVSAQQDFGTINGQNGPLYGFGGLGTASSGPAFDKQNWNTAFGALYLANVNWEFFSFGKIQQRVKLAQAEINQNDKDLTQEIFQQKVKIAAAYLNLLASQRLVISQQNNLDRAKVFQKIAAARVKNGLLAGVDSTLALAEVARAEIALNQSKDQVKEQNNNLVSLMGVPIQDFVVDSSFVKQIPKGILQANTFPQKENPVLQFYKSKIDVSHQQEQLLRREYLPSFNFVGIYQARGSGFENNYANDRTAFDSQYFKGINPTRQNYLLGIGVNWNLSNIGRTSKKLHAQRLISEALDAEYQVVEQAYQAQLNTADVKIKLALDNYTKAPKQVAAAQQAYIQKTALYRNGLTNLTDVTQVLYTLNRAETDRDIIYTNVWQALLMKAASAGDFNLFINEF